MADASTMKWTQHQIEEWIAWHEARMVELAYPPSIVKEFREARMKWFAGVKRVAVVRP